MKAQKIPIQGMHCRSCEILIEDELKKIPGVRHVSVSHKTGVAEVSCKHRLDEQAVVLAVENAGYRVGSEEKAGLISRNQRDYIELGIAFFIATALFLIARTLGIFNLGSSVTGSYSSLPVVFLVGLTAGVSTCMALVGGLVLGASARFAAKHPGASGAEKFKPHLAFNLGRIASYFVLGGLIGLAGSFFQLSTSVLGTLTIAVGLVMLLLGGQLIDIFPGLKKVSFTLPKSIHRALGIQEKSKAEYSHTNSAVMGALTFFLPCGFTQAMQLYAMSTGSVTAGALTMGVFALGTAPGLLGVGGLTAMVKGQSAKLFFKTAGVVVIVLALFNLSNGFNLLGVNQKVLGAFTNDTEADGATQDPNVTLVGGVQEVRMTQKSNGYAPNKFTIKKGVPVRWIITSTDAYSCASSLVSQQLGIRKSLQSGQNVVNFTPTQAGTIRFSCSMGMYTGSFNVVDDNAVGVATPTAAVLGTSAQAPSACGGGGGCGCGAGGAKKTVSAQNVPQPTVTAVVKGNIQVIKASYTALGDISPNQFSVKANQPVRFEIEAKEDGQGCMGSVALPGLSEKIDGFVKGQTVVFDFTPTSKGSFEITCGMGVPRGQIQVI